MKKLVMAAAIIMGLGGAAQAAAPAGAPASPYDLPLVGEYVNEAGYLVIAPAAKGQNANYDVGLVDNSRKCNIQLVCGTNKVSGDATTGQKFSDKAVVAVESAAYPNFSLWPEDETIRLADDALPWDKLDPACKAFQKNNVFKRK